MNMDDMITQAQKYSGKTTGIADMLDEMQGTYEDKILPTMGGNYCKNSRIVGFDQTISLVGGILIIWLNIFFRVS